VKRSILGLAMLRVGGYMKCEEWASTKAVRGHPGKKEQSVVQGADKRASLFTREINSKAVIRERTRSAGKHREEVDSKNKGPFCNKRGE